MGASMGKQVCAVCQTSNQTGAKYCNGCGGRVAAVGKLDQNKDKATSKPTRKTKQAPKKYPWSKEAPPPQGFCTTKVKLIAVALVLVLLGVGAFLIYWFFFRGVGVRTLRFKNSCTSERWIKLDERTTPDWVSSQNFLLAPGEFNDVQLPVGEQWISGTGWVAQGCDSNGDDCSFGNLAHENNLFEWTVQFGPDGKKDSLQVYYDLSNVNSYTQSMKITPVYDKSSRDDCRAVECIFNVEKECPPQRIDNHAHGSICLGGCDLCSRENGGITTGPCEWLCCPVEDSQTCRAKGEQQNTDYVHAIKAKCPDSYAYSYDDASSSEQCWGPDVGLIIELCPKTIWYWWLILAGVLFGLLLVLAVACWCRRRGHTSASSDSPYRLMVN